MVMASSRLSALAGSCGASPRSDRGHLHGDREAYGRSPLSGSLSGGFSASLGGSGAAPDNPQQHSRERWMEQLCGVESRLLNNWQEFTEHRQDVQLRLQDIQESLERALGSESALRQRGQKAEGEVDRINRKLQLLSEAQDDHTTRLGELRGSVDGGREAVDALRGRLGEKLQEVTLAMEEQQREAVSSGETLLREAIEAGKRSSRTVAEELLRKMEELNWKLGENMASLEEQSSQGIQKNQTELERLKQDLQTSQQESKDLSSRIDGVQGGADAEAQRLEQRLETSWRGRLAEVQEQLREVFDHTLRIDQDVTDEDSRLTKLDSRMQECYTQMQHNQAQAEALQASLAQLQQQSGHRLDWTKTQLEDLRTSVSEQLVRVREDAAALIHDQQSVLRESLEAHLEEAHERGRKLREEMVGGAEESCGRLEALRETARGQEVELAALRKAVSGAEQRCDQLASAVASARQAVDTASEGAAKARKKTEQAQAEAHRGLSLEFRTETERHGKQAAEQSELKLRELRSEITSLSERTHSEMLRQHDLRQGDKDEHAGQLEQLRQKAGEHAQSLVSSDAEKLRRVEQCEQAHRSLKEAHAQHTQGLRALSHELTEQIGQAREDALRLCRERIDESSRATQRLHEGHERSLEKVASEAHTSLQATHATLQEKMAEREDHHEQLCGELKTQTHQLADDAFARVEQLGQKLQERLGSHAVELRRAHEAHREDTARRLDAGLQETIKDHGRRSEALETQLRDKLRDEAQARGEGLRALKEEYEARHEQVHQATSAQLAELRGLHSEVGRDVEAKHTALRRQHDELAKRVEHAEGASATVATAAKADKAELLAEHRRAGAVSAAASAALSGEAEKLRQEVRQHREQHLTALSEATVASDQRLAELRKELQHSLQEETASAHAETQERLKAHQDSAHQTFSSLGDGQKQLEERLKAQHDSAQQTFSSFGDAQKQLEERLHGHHENVHANLGDVHRNFEEQLQRHHASIAEKLSEESRKRHGLEESHRELLRRHEESAKESMRRLEASEVQIHEKLKGESQGRAEAVRVLGEEHEARHDKLQKTCVDLMQAHDDTRQHTKATSAQLAELHGLHTEAGRDIEAKHAALRRSHEESAAHLKQLDARLEKSAGVAETMGATAKTDKAECLAASQQQALQAEASLNRLGQEVRQLRDHHLASTAETKAAGEARHCDLHRTLQEEIAATRKETQELATTVAARFAVVTKESAELQSRLEEQLRLVHVGSTEKISQAHADALDKLKHHAGHLEDVKSKLAEQLRTQALSAQEDLSKTQEKSADGQQKAEERLTMMLRSMGQDLAELQTGHRGLGDSLGNHQARHEEALTKLGQQLIDQEKQFEKQLINQVEDGKKQLYEAREALTDHLNKTRDALSDQMGNHRLKHDEHRNEFSGRHEEHRQELLGFQGELQALQHSHLERHRTQDASFKEQLEEQRRAMARKHEEMQEKLNQHQATHDDADKKHQRHQDTADALKRQVVEHAEAGKRLVTELEQSFTISLQQQRDELAERAKAHAAEAHQRARGDVESADKELRQKLDEHAEHHAGELRQALSAHENLSKTQEKHADGQQKAEERLTMMLRMMGQDLAELQTGHRGLGDNLGNHQARHDDAVKKLGQQLIDQEKQFEKQLINQVEDGKKQLHEAREVLTDHLNKTRDALSEQMGHHRLKHDEHRNEASGKHEEHRQDLLGFQGELKALQHSHSERHRTQEASWKEQLEEQRRAMTRKHEETQEKLNQHQATHDDADRKHQKQQETADVLKRQVVEHAEAGKRQVAELEQSFTISLQQHRNELAERAKAHAAEAHQRARGDLESGDKELRQKLDEHAEHHAGELRQAQTELHAKLAECKSEQLAHVAHESQTLRAGLLENSGKHEERLREAIKSSEHDRARDDIQHKKALEEHKAAHRKDLAEACSRVETASSVALTRETESLQRALEDARRLADKGTREGIDAAAKQLALHVEFAARTAGELRDELQGEAEDLRSLIARCSRSVDERHGELREELAIFEKELRLVNEELPVFKKSLETTRQQHATAIEEMKRVAHERHSQLQRKLQSDGEAIQLLAAQLAAADEGSKGRDKELELALQTAMSRDKKDQQADLGALRSDLTALQAALKGLHVEVSQGLRNQKDSHQGQLADFSRRLEEMTSGCARRFDELEALGAQARLLGLFGEHLDGMVRGVVSRELQVFQRESLDSVEWKLERCVQWLHGANVKLGLNPQGTMFSTDRFREMLFDEAQKGTSPAATTPTPRSHARASSRRASSCATSGRRAAC